MTPICTPAFRAVMFTDRNSDTHIHATNDMTYLIDLTINKTNKRVASILQLWQKVKNPNCFQKDTIN